MADEKPDESIEALMPKSLDDVFRQNRDKASIHLSTDEELAPFLSNILEKANLYATVEDWRLITLKSKTQEVYRVRLLGRLAHSGESWFTSVIRLIDFEHGVVQTHNNFYGLGNKGEGEPPFRDLAILCTSLNRQGLGAYFGIPSFFL
jgi:hypothetical protein